MGHYLSEMNGLPFTITLKCEVDKDQYKNLEKIIDSSKEASNIELEVESITADKNRTWFNAGYTLKRIPHIQVLKINEISTALGEDYVSHYMKKLEEKRQKVINS